MRERTHQQPPLPVEVERWRSSVRMLGVVCALWERGDAPSAELARTAMGIVAGDVSTEEVKSEGEDWLPLCELLEDGLAVMAGRGGSSEERGECKGICGQYRTHTELRTGMQTRVEGGFEEKPR